MSKLTVTRFMLSLILVLGCSSRNFAAQSTPNSSDAPTGTFQKMIDESGGVTMDLDLNRLNGSPATAGVARPITLQFVVGANSFFPILVFNDVLRAAEPGSITLVPAGVNAPGYSNLPVRLAASLKQVVVEKLASDQAFDLAVRDAKTGFTFFNIEGGDYD